MLNVRKSARAAGLAAVCHLALACSSEGDGANGGSLINGGAAGIYQVTTSTFNEAGCDAEGPSDLEESNFKYVYMVNRMGGIQMYVHAVFCTDPEDCRTTHRRLLEPNSMFTGSTFFERPTGEFVDDSVGRTSIMDGQCVGITLRHAELSISGDSFRVDIRRSEPAPYPPDQGDCYNIESRADLEDIENSGTCLSYQVYRGTFAETL